MLDEGQWTDCPIDRTLLLRSGRVNGTSVRGLPLCRCSVVKERIAEAGREIEGASHHRPVYPESPVVVPMRPASGSCSCGEFY